MLIALCASPLGAAQLSDTIRAGDPALVGAALPLGVDTISRRLLRESGVVDWGNLVRQVTLTRADGEQVYLVVSRAPVEGGETLDSLLISSGGLAPIAFSHRTPRVFARWTYTGQFVAGTFDDPTRPGTRVPVGEFVVPGGSRQRVAAQLHHQPFDAAQLELLVPLLPLGDGYRVTLPIFDLEGERFVQLAVTGSEQLDFRGDFVDCWVVRSGAGPGPVTTYWIAKRQPHLLQTSIRLPAGPELRSVLR